MANQTRDKSVTLNPKQALELLVEGNLRFTQKKLDEHDRFIVQKELQDAQYPFLYRFRYKQWNFSRCFFLVFSVWRVSYSAQFPKF